MKGLLYKDLIVMKRTYRVYLFLVLLFFGISIFNPSNTFWAVYATFLTCTVVSTLAGYLITNVIFAGYFAGFIH